jgi:hypothetical protein
VPYSLASGSTRNIVEEVIAIAVKALSHLRVSGRSSWTRLQALVSVCVKSTASFNVVEAAEPHTNLIAAFFTTNQIRIQIERTAAIVEARVRVQVGNAIFFSETNNVGPNSR